MKREELKALELTDEQVNSVMKLFGKSVTELQNGLSAAQARILARHFHPTDKARNVRKKSPAFPLQKARGFLSLTPDSSAMGSGFYAFFIGLLVLDSRYAMIACTCSSVAVEIACESFPNALYLLSPKE